MDFIRFQDSDTLSLSGLILEPDTNTLEHKMAILQSTQTIGFKYRILDILFAFPSMQIKNLEISNPLITYFPSWIHILPNSFFFLSVNCHIYHDLYIFFNFLSHFYP